MKEDTIKDHFNERVKKGKYLKKIIKNHIEKSNIKDAKAKIKEYKEIFKDDIEIDCVEAMISIVENDLVKAEKITKEGLNKAPFHFDSLYNLAYIFELKQEYQKSADKYLKALPVSKTDEEREDIEKGINRIKKVYPGLDLSVASKLNPKLFPLKEQKETYVSNPLFKVDEKSYFPLYYEGGYTKDYPVELWNFYKTETLLGKKYTDKKFTIETEEKSILPIATLTKDTRITIEANENKYELNDLTPKRYHYLPIEKEGEIKVFANNDTIVGKSISKVQRNSHDVKLALCLFVDGLAQKIFDRYPMEEIMPNTYAFFKKGAIFNNCHSNAEWTFSSVPSIFSGRYQANHKIFHPELPHVIGEGYTMLSEFFQYNNYFTFQACGNWRKTPAYGYVKGFDRSIYQSGTMGGLCNDIIFSFLENMRAFGGRDHFAWLSFFELHRVGEQLIPDISVQVDSSIELQGNKAEKNKSVNLKYDEKKMSRYANEIKRLDFYMKLIYDFIEKNYNEDEILIALCSDHGQSYLDQEDHVLSATRTNVPFMLRGRGVPQIVSNELIENVDILPTLLEHAGLKIEEAAIDGRIPKTLGGKKEKEYVYSESIYPGKTYKAIIRDNKYTFIFETEGNVQQDGRVELGDYKVRLENTSTNTDVTNENFNKVERYINIVMEHVKEMIIV